MNWRTPGRSGNPARRTSPARGRPSRWWNSMTAWPPGSTARVSCRCRDSPWPRPCPRLSQTPRWPGSGGAGGATSRWASLPEPARQLSSRWHSPTGETYGREGKAGTQGCVGVGQCATERCRPLGDQSCRAEYYRRSSRDDAHRSHDRENGVRDPRPAQQGGNVTPEQLAALPEAVERLNVQLRHHEVATGTTANPYYSI